MRQLLADFARLLPSGGRPRPHLDENGHEEPPAQVALFGGMVNTRPILLQPNGVHAAPDPIAQGTDTPSRPSRWQFVQTFHDMALSVSEESFVAVITSPRPLASTPRGRLQADPARANLRVPPHVAYGSLFVGNDPAPYGLG
jgi:hypothetical protein